MIPSKIKIESFVERCHMGTLGGKGLSECGYQSNLTGRSKKRKVILESLQQNKKLSLLKYTSHML